MAEANPLELANAIADGKEVDWDQVMTEVKSSDATVVQNLSRISRLMSAHRRLAREHLPFETWGNLRLLEKIGEGGYGEVYRAWDESLGREVALKLFRQKQEGVSVRATISSQRADDLMLEARRLARVRHENVVHVYGAEEHRDRAGFWMELINGETLASLMHGQGAMDPEEAAHIGVRLCSGLSSIHQAGLLHRDIKAQNVMQEADGRIVLTDMGAGVDLRFSATGLPRSIAGTPLYMAPEMIEGGGGDHTADIYSVGILLYHLVTGRFPYESQTYSALQDDHQADRRISLTERRPDLPETFVEIVRRATAHDPRNRYQSAAEMEAVLRPLAADPALPESTRPNASRPRPIYIALLAMVLVAAGLWAGRDLLAPTPTVTEAAAPRGQIRRLTFSGKAKVPVWSPDGRMIAFTEEGQLRVMSPDGGPSRGIAYPDSGRGIAWCWTPDSKAVLAHASGPGRGAMRVVRVGVLNDETRTLAEGGRFPAMSTDGKLLAFAAFGPSGYAGIDLLDMESGDRRTLVVSPEPGTAVYKPLFAPDGERMAYVRWVGWGHELWIVNLDGSSQRQIQTGPLRPAGLYCFTEDGEHLLIGAKLYGVSSIWKIAVDGSEWVALTEGGATQEHVSRGPGSDTFVFGRTSHSSKLVFVDPRSGELSYPASLELAVRQPMLSSDGLRLYFQALVNGVWEIWQTRLDGNGATTPLISQANVSCFSPVPATGGILHLRGVVPNTTVFGEVKWQQTLWFTTEDGGQSRRWEWVGDHVYRLAPGGERDGRILYSQNAAPGGEAYFVADDRGNAREIDRDDDHHEVFYFEWGRTSDEVVLLTRRRDNSGSTMAIETLDLRTGEASPLITDALVSDALASASSGGVTMEQCRGLATSPDGARLALLFSNPAASMTRVLEYDYVTGSIREVRTIVDDHLGAHLAWAPDGNGLVITLSKTSNDIYIREPRPDTEVAVAGPTQAQ